MSTLLVVLLVVAVLAVAAAVVVVRSGRRSFATANEVVPGVATRAPAEWAGSHSPEAKLHRRIRDAVAALRADPALDDGGMLGTRTTLEQQALGVDERLVAAAALPERVRAEPLARVASAVDALEVAVASLGEASPALGTRTALDDAMAEVTERVALLAEARAELDGGTGAGPS